MRLELQTAATERSGYGALGFAMRRELHLLGCSLEERAPVRLLIAPPFCYEGRWEDQEVWIWTMFESTRLPEVFVEALGNFKGVIVPNRFNQQQYSQFHENVKVVPLGYDPKIYYPWRREVDKEFRFLFIGRGVRKGGDIADEAYRLAFPDAEKMDPRPVLVKPRVRGDMTDEQVSALYYDAHCYVAPSRGEGWHLLPFQALASGMPVIVSRNPGHTEWSTAGCYMIGTHMTPSIIGGAGRAWSGEWWESRPEDFAERMRWVYQNYQRAHQWAMEGATKLRMERTWHHSAIKLLEVLGPQHRPEPKPIWEPPRLRRFPVTPLKSGEADIGGVHYSLTRGIKQSVSADAKRVLLGAGFIDDEQFWQAWSEAE